MGPRRHRRPAIVWVPVGTNVALVALAALLDDPTAVALTSVAAVVVTGAVVVHLRESEVDKERIAYLQAAMPKLSPNFNTEDALNLAPKPSAVLADVYRQQQEAAALERRAAIRAVSPIDRT